MDTLAHHFILLEHTDDTGVSLIGDGILRHVAIAGAFVGELQLRDRLVPVAADRFTLASGASDHPLLREAERLLPGGGAATTALRRPTATAGPPRSPLTR